MSPTVSLVIRAASRSRYVAGIVALAGVLLLSMLTGATAADAATTVRTPTELRIGHAVELAMNAERRAHHVPYVHMDQRLRLSARWHNLTMARYNSLSHQLPHEASFGARISHAGYHWHYAGENIGWNSAMTQAGVVALERMMYNERPPNDGHRLNILNPHYTNVGIDVYIDRAHHKVWLTTDFGRH